MRKTTLTLELTHDEKDQLTHMQWGVDDPEAKIRHLLDGAIAFLLKCLSKTVEKENIHEVCERLSATLETALYTMIDNPQEDINE